MRISLPAFVVMVAAVLLNIPKAASVQANGDAVTTAPWIPAPRPHCFRMVFPESLSLCAMEWTGREPLLRMRAMAVRLQNLIKFYDVFRKDALIRQIQKGRCGGRRT